MKSRHLSRIFIVIGLVFALVHAARAVPANLRPGNLPPGLTCTENRKQTVCCRKAAWTDLLTFYLGNYIAHAVTTKTLPGQSKAGSIFTILTALLFPMSGALRGVHFILSGAVFANTDLQAAARAGALCMVVQDPKRNLDGFVTRQRSSSHCVMFPSATDLFTDTLNFRSTAIHGRCQLPPGYVLMVVPGYVTFEDDGSAVPNGSCIQTIWTSIKRIYLNIKTTFMPISQRATTISSSYSLVKIVIAILQALFATSTLYSSAGDQIDRFGYAAFGLTVAPYAVMTIVNLLGSLICPEYSAMYIVETETLRDLQSSSQARSVQGQLPAQDNLSPVQEEAPGVEQQEPSPQQEKEKLCIVSTVGILTEDSDRAMATQLSKSFSKPHDARSESTIAFIDELKDNGWEPCLYFLLIGITVGIIGGLSRFQKHSSSPAQRVWTMTWLAFGFLFGPSVEFYARNIESREFLNVRRRSSPILNVVTSLVCGVPAIGGLVAVGQMIKAYGVCSFF